MLSTDGWLNSIFRMLRYPSARARTSSWWTVSSVMSKGSPRALISYKRRLERKRESIAAWRCHHHHHRRCHRPLSTSSSSSRLILPYLDLILLLRQWVWNDIYRMVTNIYSNSSGIHSYCNVRRNSSSDFSIYRSRIVAVVVTAACSSRSSSRNLLHLLVSRRCPKSIL